MRSFRNLDEVEYAGVTNERLTKGEYYTVKDMAPTLSGGADGPLSIRVRLVGFDIFDMFHPDDFELVGGL